VRHSATHTLCRSDSLGRTFVRQAGPAIWGALGALLLWPAVTTGQHLQSTLDVGVVSLRYADSLSVSAATLTPDIRMEWARAVAQATGTFSQFKGGGWSAQGTASGSVFTTLKRGFLGELAGIGGGSAHHDGTRTGQAIANIRVHAMRVRTGIFSGVGGGSTWDGGSWRRLLLGEIGAWIQGSPGTALLTITPVAVNDSIRYLDGQLALSRTGKRFDLSALAGARAGSQNPSVDTRTRAWGSLSAVAWVIPRLALVASGGTYPVDPTQGFPGGRFVSVSVRLATSGVRPGRTIPDPVATTEPLLSEPLTGLESFSVHRQTPDTLVLRVSAPGAQLVEVTGDFSGWSPVPMKEREGGTWEAGFSLPPGQYQMNLRVDGGNWVVPPGLLSLKDEFGGSVGLLVIE
jgi:Glycogen recognition site of AMP-activated protein kinase